MLENVLSRTHVVTDDIETFNGKVKRKTHKHLPACGYDRVKNKSDQMWLNTDLFAMSLLTDVPPALWQLPTQ